MNQQVLRSKWTQLKGAIQNQWSLLTDEDIKRISGKEDILLDKLQERYGYNFDEAQKKIKAFYNHAKLRSTARKTERNIKQIGSSLHNQAKRSPFTLAAIASLGGLLIGMFLNNKMSKGKMRFRFKR